MATGTTEHIDVTTADIFIGENWSKQYIIAREKLLIFSPTFTHKYQADLKMGDTVHIPLVSNLTAQTKNTSSNAAVVFETVTETQVNLIINTWRYNGIAVETYTASLTNSDLMMAYAPKQAYAIAEAFDAALAAFVDDFGTNIVGTLNQDLTYEDLLLARQYLGDSLAPFMNRHICISPAQEAGFLKIDQFISGEYDRLATLTASQAAAIGTWMGVPVHVSTNVEGSNAIGHDNSFHHEEAVGWAMSLEPTVHRMFDINYIANKVVIEQGDGAIELRDNHGVWARGT